MGAPFKDDFSTTKGVVPASLKTVVMKGDFYADTFVGCDHLTSIVLENVTGIPENAFDGCILPLQAFTTTEPPNSGAKLP